MFGSDVRWTLRFANYQKALEQLSKFVAKKNLNELEIQGLIQSFEYTHELAWKTLKDFLLQQGNQEIYGSKDTARLAFQLNIIENGELWMEMIESRNQTSHTYNEDVAKQIADDVKTKYYPEFVKLLGKLNELKEHEVRT